MMCQCGEKLKKPHSFVIIRGLKGLDEINNFSKIRLEHFFRLSMFYLTAKFQKKVIKGFRENALRTDGRTNGRTDEG